MAQKQRLTALFITALMAFAAMFMVLATEEAAFAASPIGKITVDGKTTEYTEYKPLKQALEKLGGKTITVEMLDNWNHALSGMSVGERLKIPSGSVTTLEMNGYMFNRDLSRNNNTKDDGELIVVYDGATLIINGEKENNIPRSHFAYAYNSTDKDDKPVRTTFVGGLLTGGASFDGAGGIHVYGNTTIVLNKVTLAGCRATKKGYGGGMYLAGSNTKVVLNNSTITGCFAGEDGGAIYGENKNNISIELNNSHIDNNYAHNDCGGINFDGPSASIVGDGNSTIANNESEQRGGGVLMFGHKGNVSNLVITGNKANDGAGIYVDKGGDVLENLTIENNIAAGQGGGICYGTGDDISEAIAKAIEEAMAQGKMPTSITATYYTSHSLRNCTVQGNKAWKGGGVQMYGGKHIAGTRFNPAIDYYQTVNLKGHVVINDNTCTHNNEFKNVYVDASDAEYARIGTDLSEGSSVGISYRDNDYVETITLTPPRMRDNNSTKYLVSDQDGWYFDFGGNSTVRKRGRKPEAPPATPVTTADAYNPSTTVGDGNTKAGKVGTVGPGGAEGSDYDLIRFFSDHEAHDFISAVYYSDGLFYEDPKTYNEHLATASWALAYAGGYINKREDPDANGNVYFNKHAAARQFLADIGCPDQSIYVSDSNVTQPLTDTIGVTIGSKELAKADGTKTGDVLIPITVRGLNYELEWISNLALGYSHEMRWQQYEAKGFNNIAYKVFSDISYYLDKYGLREKYTQGKVKFWITGFSRAGAAANITAKRLVETIQKDCPGEKSQVFAYTCEAAMGGTDKAETLQDKTKYYCIHNMVNKADIVPYVGPKLMGFKRYGVDHYIPGTPAGAVTKKEKDVMWRSGDEGPLVVTTYSDNVHLRTKGANKDDAESKRYEAQRDLMLQQLMAIDSNIVFDDYFHPMTLDFLDIGFFDYEVMNQYEYGDWENNRLEDFVEDVVRFAMEGKEPDHYGHWSQAISTRERYARDALSWDYKGYTSYSTVQEALQFFMQMIMTMPSAQAERFSDKISGVVDEFDIYTFMGVNKVKLYLDVVGDWHTLDYSDKRYYADEIFKAVEKTGALDGIPEQQKPNLKKYYYVVLDLALRFLDGDYNYKPKNNNASKDQPEWAHGSNGTMMYIPTLITYLEQILSYHTPQINMAWARTYDSWYDNELTEYVLTPPASVDAPKAYIPVTEEAENGEQQTRMEELIPGESEDNLVILGQRITLENDAITGEAVYYDLIDVTEGTTTAQNRIYRGGIDLTLGNVLKKQYQIKTYDMSYGVKSEIATYNITLINGRHKFIINDKDASGKNRKQNFTYIEGQNALVQAGVAQDYYFNDWTVKLLDSKGEFVRDVTEELLGSEGESVASQEAVKITVPSVDEDYPEAYQLEFTANYGERIKALRIEAIDPQAGQDLAKTFTIIYNVKKPAAAASGSSDGQSPFTTGAGTTQDGYITKDYPIAWTYEDDGKTVVPSDDDYAAYNNTVYTATITLPQEQAEGIVFFNQVSALIAPQPESFGELVQSRVERNTADGSIVLQIVFEATEDSGGSDKPSTTQSFKVNAIDLNINAQDIDTDVVEYSSHPNQTMTITAPNVPGEQFVAWDLKESGIVLANVEGNALTNKTITITTPGDMPEGAEIDATYVPVVKTVDVNLYDAEGELFAPIAGGQGPDHVEMFVKVSNEYEVHPDNLRVTWTPEVGEGDTFKYLTNYTATVDIVADANGKVRVRPKGSTSDDDYNEIELIVLPANDMAVTCNGNTENVTFDTAEQTVSKVFPPTNYTLAAVVNPDNISDVEHGKSQADIEGMLPTTTRILTENGLEFDAEIEWTEVTEEKAEDDPRAASVWTATGTVKLPDTVDNTNDVPVEVTMTVSVGEAQTAMSPSSSLSTGTYLYNQVATLQCDEEGGVIYYTTDGSDPTPESKVYEGEQIIVSRDSDDLQDELDSEGNPTGRKAFILQAYTVKDGKWDSVVSAYQYVFDNEVSIPEGETSTYTGAERTGVSAGLLYNLEPVSDGVEIDDAGNAVAVNAGEYEVKAKLASDTYKWVTNEYEQSTDTAANRSKTYYTKDENLEDTYSTVSPSAYIEIDDETDEVIPANPSEKGWYEKKTSTEDQIIRFTINPADLTEVADVQAEGTFKSVDDLKKALNVNPTDERTLTEGTDYEVAYSAIKDNKVDVTVTGKGNYSGTITKTFTVTPPEPKPDPTPDPKPDPKPEPTPAKAALKSATAPAQKYTGKALKPAVTVKDANGKTVPASAYTVTYANNTYPGTATATIKAKANSKYTGTVKATFKITAAEQAVYWLVHKKTGENLYTTAVKEVNTLSKVKKTWTNKGIMWYAPTVGEPIYRLYNPKTGDHHFTKSANEVRVLTKVRKTWKADFDGKPIFYSGGPKKIWRQYSESRWKANKPGTHKFTTFNAKLSGWKNEGALIDALRYGKVNGVK